ncbi:hypothetical protein KC328_g55 [Hortaea werneckii]|nr:hypothetical protein KC328_g55 [Hortaea werneckii]
MALSTLPSELRLRIYDYLPDIADGRSVAVTDASRLVPPICRTSRQIHQETIPIYAENTHFAIDTSEDSQEGASLLSSWLAALRPSGVRWPCGILREIGKRSRRVAMLDWHLSRGKGHAWDAALIASDIELIVSAMMVVASHPISAFDTEQSEAGKKRRREIWADMEENLFGLHANDGMLGIYLSRKHVSGPCTYRMYYDARVAPFPLNRAGPRLERISSSCSIPDCGPPRFTLRAALPVVE